MFSSPDWNIAIEGSSGVVVKLFACGARGPRFDSQLPLQVQRLVIYCFQVAIWLKDRLSDVNPQSNQQTNIAIVNVIYVMLATLT